MIRGGVKLATTQLKKGTLELCVLALLSHNEWYGYELTQELNQVMIVKDATIYLILQRLEKAGLVSSYVKTLDDSTKVRKYYTITKSGSEGLQTLVNEWNSLGDIVTTCIEKGRVTND